MEIIVVQKDIKAYYINAESFPDGIQEVHEKLHALVPFSKERRYFGISRPENGVIVYKAAAEELKDIDKDFNYQSMIIKKGKYRCITILNYRENPQRIGKAFEELVSFSDIDPNGYCVEWYCNDKDVKCIVRLIDID